MTCKHPIAELICGFRMLGAVSILPRPQQKTIASPQLHTKTYRGSYISGENTRRVAMRALELLCYLSRNISDDHNAAKLSLDNKSSCAAAGRCYTHVRACCALHAFHNMSARRAGVVRGLRM